MKSPLNIILSLLLLLLPCTIFAQDIDEEMHEDNITPAADTIHRALTIDAQVRARGEYRHGAITAFYDYPAAYFVNERARLSIGYASKNIQLKIGAQHTGVWGDQSLTGSSSGFSLADAWGQISTSNSKFSARIGRQALSYDNGRILGANDWTTTGTFHNALRLTYEDEWNKVHLIGAISQNSERTYSTYYDNSTTQLYKNLEALWYHYGNKSFPLQASVLVMNAGYEAGTTFTRKTIYRQTMGVNVSYNTEHFGAEAEGYYQHGSATNDTVTNAWMAAVNFRYTVNRHWTIKAGYDYLSGTDSLSVKNHSFMPQYGSMHGFYGAMDYFGKSYFQNGSSGLADAHASVQWNASKDIYVLGAYHFFTTAADPIGHTGSMVRLSSEIDLTAGWQINRDASIMAGGAYSFNTSTFDYLMGGNHKKAQYFAFVQVNISPRVLFHKW